MTIPASEQEKIMKGVAALPELKREYDDETITLSENRVMESEKGARLRTIIAALEAASMLASQSGVEWNEALDKAISETDELHQKAQWFVDNLKEEAKTLAQQIQSVCSDIKQRIAKHKKPIAAAPSAPAPQGMDGLRPLLERLERFTDGFEPGEEGHKLNRQIQYALEAMQVK